ncbi:MAG: hypothetical protein OES69_12185, partial [Myxococcales bacterium]|nr:hypothetical protein [Myxococcales bacterium]
GAAQNRALYQGYRQLSKTKLGDSVGAVGRDQLLAEGDPGDSAGALGHKRKSLAHYFFGSNTSVAG